MARRKRHVGEAGRRGDGEMVDRRESFNDNEMAWSKYMRNKISVIGVGLLVGMALVGMNGCSGVVEKFSGTQHIHRVQETGKSAEAKVLKIWDTGIKVNDNPVVGFSLEVKPMEGDVYQATMQCIISILDIPQVQPGLVLAAKYDAEDHSKVALAICR